MKPALSLVDWLVVGLYFALVGLVALRVSGGQRTTKEYFLAGRMLPWWAATLSIIATETSAVTFMGVPRAAYEDEGNWSLLQLVAGFVLGRLFLAAFFVRVVYGREFITVYGYLAERFGPVVRSLAGLLFLSGRLVASGVRLLAGCVALQVAAGLSADRLILAVVGLGGFGTLYTLAGGIRAVVWTDVLLGLTFVGAAALCAAYLLAGIPGGPSELLATGEFLEKIAIHDFDLSLANERSFLAGVAGGFILTLATHGTDQDIAQRMLTCRDSRGGSLSLIGSAVLILPLWTVLLAVGTLLYFFYQTRPPSYALPADLNHILPIFIVRELPHGLSGMVMAGLLAASLSSFTSVLNALSSSAVDDFYRPLRRWLLGGRPEAREEAHLLRASRALTLFWGVALIMAALLFRDSDANILNLALQALTYFYGALLGAFLLGIFTARGSAATVSLGMLLSVPAVLLLQLRSFLAEPAAAPSAARWLMEKLGESARAFLLEYVPQVAWPYWVAIGTAVTVGVGALGSPRLRRSAKGIHPLLS